jgi:hypothetical protein
MKVASAGENITTTMEWPSPTDPHWVSVWPSEHSQIEVLPPADPTQLTEPSAQLRSARTRRLRSGAVYYGCTNPHYNLYWPGDTSRRSWYPAYGFNYKTVLPNSSWDYLVAQGFGVWAITSNVCGFGDQSKVQSNQIGTTYPWQASATDGQNLIGGIASDSVCGPGALACTATAGYWRPYDVATRISR